MIGNKLVIGTASILVILYAVTWWFGVPAAQAEARKEVVHSMLSDSPPGDRSYTLDVQFTWTVPIFPGVIYTNAYPTVDGRGPCTSSSVVVVWYGLGAHVIAAPWKNVSNERAG